MNDQLNSIGHFSNDMTLTVYGNCHTLEQNATISTFDEYRSGVLTFTVNKTLENMFFIGDPRYFYLSVNPGMVPGFKVGPQRLSKTLALNGAVSRIWNIKIIKHIKRNTAESPCNADVNYSFTECLKSNVEAQVGCSLPWEKNRKLSKCKKLDQYEHYENIYDEVDKTANVPEAFGCPAPCEYLEYQLVENLSGPTNEQQEVWLSLATQEMLVKTEKPMYELTSLVGDIGGSLGLFLGFSLLMLWDWVCFLYMLIESKICAKIYQ